MRRVASAGRKSRSSGPSVVERTTKYVICVANDGVEVSLEIGKVYRHVPEEKSCPKSMVRVIDESGEDYLFPRRLFKPVVLSASVQRALSRSRLAA